MKEKINQNCGKRLSQCRKEAKMSQKDLADQLFITVPYLSMIENGKKRLSTEIAYKAAELLRVRPQYLLCKDDVKTPENRWLSASLKYQDTLKNFNALLGLADDMMVYEEKYLIGSEIGGETDYILCSFEELQEISSMIRLLFKGWFDDKFNNQYVRNNELSENLQKYASKHTNKRLEYEAVLNSIRRETIKDNGVDIKMTYSSRPIKE